MTALKPVESWDVKAVASEKYPSNRVCAHPECSEKVDLRPDGTPTVHHAFPRGFINSDSYFVSIDGGDPIPHAVGLCGSGTTKHHGDVEEHRARLVLEDGVWYWEQRAGEPEASEDYRPLDAIDAKWERLGALNPQPGSVEGKAKRRPRGQAREGKSETYTLRAPKGESMAVLLEVLDVCADRIQQELGAEEKPLPYATLSFLAAHYLQSA